MDGPDASWVERPLRPTDPAPTGRLTNPMAAPPSGAAALYSAGLVHPRSRRSTNGATDDRAAVALAQSADIGLWLEGYGFEPQATPSILTRPRDLASPR